MCAVLLSLLSHINSQSVDVFTLQNERKIYCLTYDEKTPMYVLPPVDEESKQPLTLLNDNDWNEDGWIMTDANNSCQAYITDKRWECK
jgi:hypothetical protein